MTDVSRIVCRNLVCAPITALCFAAPTLLLAAQGPYLKLFRISGKVDALLYELPVLVTHRIHVLIHDEESNRVLIAGGKEVALVAIDITKSVARPWYKTSLPLMLTRIY